MHCTYISTVKMICSACRNIKTDMQGPKKTRQSEFLSLKRLRKAAVPKGNSPKPNHSHPCREQIRGASPQRRQAGVPGLFVLHWHVPQTFVRMVHIPSPSQMSSGQRRMRCPNSQRLDHFPKTLSHSKIHLNEAKYSAKLQIVKVLELKEAETLLINSDKVPCYWEGSERLC